MVIKQLMPMTQAISASHTNEQEDNSEFRSDQQLDMDFVLNIKSDSKWLDFPQQV